MNRCLRSKYGSIAFCSSSASISSSSYSVVLPPYMKSSSFIYASSPAAIPNSAASTSSLPAYSSCFYFSLSINICGILKFSFAISLKSTTFF